MNMHLFRRTALALLIAVAAATPARAQKARVDALVSFFDAVAFGSELDPALANTVVAKWRDGPIHVAIRNLKVGQEPLLVFARDHLQRIAAITGLPFRGTQDAAKADLEIIFVKRAQMAAIQIPNTDPAVIRKAADGGGCYFLSWKKPEDTIVKAIIVVNTERENAAINSCILEEITQSIGLPNDTDLMRPSIFSDKDRLYDLSPSDEILVRTLYDIRMKRGLTRPQALAVARRIIAELISAPVAPASPGQGG